MAISLEIDPNIILTKQKAIKPSKQNKNRGKTTLYSHTQAMESHQSKLRGLISVVNWEIIMNFPLRVDDLMGSNVTFLVGIEIPGSSKKIAQLQFL